MNFKKDDYNLYFVALVPSEPLQARLMDLKAWVCKETGSKGALRSPAHITLHMPFKWKAGKQKILLASLEKLALSNLSFELQLSNFGCFKPRVIYVDIEKSEQLIHLKNEVMKLSRMEWKLNLPKDLRGFNPHITIGFRDLKKPQFYKIWENIKEQTFKSTFIVNTLVLLKHNGKSWDIHQTFELARP